MNLGLPIQWEDPLQNREKEKCYVFAEQVMYSLCFWFAHYKNKVFLVLHRKSQIQICKRGTISRLLK
jgi:hypothetical protein